MPAEVSLVRDSIASMMSLSSWKMRAAWGLLSLVPARGREGEPDKGRCVIGSFSAVPRGDDALRQDAQELRRTQARAALRGDAEPLARMTLGS